MSSTTTSTTSAASSQKAKRKVSRSAAVPENCGAYNYTGCYYEAGNCRFAHAYDLRAGNKYYESLQSSLKSQKGLRQAYNFPSEFGDLRNRNVNSLRRSSRAYLLWTRRVRIQLPQLPRSRRESVPERRRDWSPKSPKRRRNWSPKSPS
jgi:hypothetical protein